MERRGYKLADIISPAAVNKVDEREIEKVIGCKTKTESEMMRKCTVELRGTVGDNSLEGSTSESNP